MLLLPGLSSCQTAAHTAAETETVSIFPPTDSLVAGIPIYATFPEIEPLLHQQNDTTYLINFWATWCKPCVEELPFFEAVHTKLEGKPFKVILVSLDFPAQIESSLVPFVAKNQLRSQVLVLLDGKYNNWIDKVSPEWSGALPATYLYRNNEVRFKGSSFKDLAELEAFIDPLL
ncbi:MAG: TlpA disulfide reductase family protein [Bacteroidota bacterium]